MKNIKLLLAALMLATSAPGMAGEATDAMAQCLVSSSSEADRTALIRWIFAAMAQHPAVAPMVANGDVKLEQRNAEAGALLMRLLTEDCPAKAKQAMERDGPKAMEAAFQTLGQVAAQGMFSDKSVVAVMSGLEKNLDPKKLQAVFK